MDNVSGAAWSNRELSTGMAYSVTWTHACDGPTDPAKRSEILQPTYQYLLWIRWSATPTEPKTFVDIAIDLTPK